MTVLLRHSTELPQNGTYDAWVSIDTQDLALPTRQRLDVGEALEAAFDREATRWWGLVASLATGPGSNLSHTVACVPNASDFGLMLAWSALAEGWIAERRRVLVVCDDPWVYRHLKGHAGIAAGDPPRRWVAELRLRLRGWAARSLCALRLASLALRHRPKPVIGRAAWLLVYAHPKSTAHGDDAYFGDRLRRFPGLRRMLHVDGLGQRAQELLAHDATDTLHAWGNPIFALTVLPTARWRPTRGQQRGPHGWLIRRAAAREASTAQATMIRWQMHCQRRWLEQARPSVVAWPWENHAWERALVRDAKEREIPTAGYQHSVIGRQMLNYAPASNDDGGKSLPDSILCNGRVTRDHLTRWQVPENRLVVAGALRFPEIAKGCWSASAPIFLALPFDGLVAAEMIAAARRASAAGFRFLVKDHPMTPCQFTESDTIRRTKTALSDQPAVSAVVFAATTVGLEAVLMELPCLRFRSSRRVALDILPDGVSVPVTSAETLAPDLHSVRASPLPRRDDIFSPIDEGVWARIFASPAGDDTRLAR